MEEYLRSSRDWFSKKADNVYARAWLGVLSFTESCVFVIPPDPLLAAMVFVHKERWIRYATIASVASILGAVAGYVLGWLLFDTVGIRVVDFYGLHEYMAQATTVIHEGVFVFTLTAAFTPIPFKVAVLAAGFTKANIFAFLIATIIGRSARYLLIAYVARVFGQHAEHIMRKFWFYTTVAGIVVLALFAGFMFFQ
ncbi:DedA family protein [Candidatus Kaiserbacteria bacterium]|nr:MAG: DedA family protein [Candidatus Kaiserbacteria bacterium]